ncbi:hypothetical protein SY83_00070 [Paenibacillus swuensis]|uniref:Uncharacterized protein n=1 Tax=Paenibacillus swuensis TaxID=1178515 RepID=A0A172TDK6_9BACL|nr:hypothetical protein SY83_00070 [Paenibacillus swuensis]
MQLQGPLLDRAIGYATALTTIRNMDTCSLAVIDPTVCKFQIFNLSIGFIGPDVIIILSAILGQAATGSTSGLQHFQSVADGTHRRQKARLLHIKSLELACPPC